MMFPRKSALRAPAATGRASEPARPRSLPPLLRAVWRWLKTPVAMLATMWAADTPEHLPEDESAHEGAASGTCSGGGHGTPSPEPFRRTLRVWVEDFIGAASLFVLVAVLLFIGSAIQ